LVGFEYFSLIFGTDTVAAVFHAKHHIVACFDFSETFDRVVDGPVPMIDGCLPGLAQQQMFPVCSLPGMC
jgi:hypothetical protein